MKRSRVEIGSLVVHGANFTPAEGSTFQGMVEANLQRLLMRQSAPTSSHGVDVLRVRVPGSVGINKNPASAADAVANVLYRGLQRKA